MEGMQVNRIWTTFHDIDRCQVQVIKTNFTVTTAIEAAPTTAFAIATTVGGDERLI